MVIEHDGKIMTIPNAKLHMGIRQTKNIVSKFKDQVYDLVDFVWIPDTEKPIPPPEDKQQKLL